MTLPKTLLVPTDFSEPAAHALDYAVGLAANLGAKIYLLNVIGIPALGIPELGVAVTAGTIETTIRFRQADLEQLVAGYTPAAIEPMLRTGDAVGVISDVAREIGADLIIMGTHGRRGVRRALLGSIAEGVLRTAPCPVLTIREPGQAKAA
ncbi:MAG TPA: universal stress protein [Kofleriaceae bacterium]